MVPRGTTALVLLLCFYLLLQSGRAVFHEENPPAFFVREGEGIWVLLGSGFPRPGLHQFYDGCTLAGAIEMTVPFGAGKEICGADPEHILLPGEALEILALEEQVIEIELKWMPAEQRMALGIPLHPDRMVCTDWQALPGIGPKLAERIELERQSNGDFGALEGLRRVRGIGERRMEAWKKFFGG
ncbi:competence protein ComEA [Desulfuromonas versatilis]|uniref:Competence protein ComEA n=1 Tax=Desulfuromonas versatilis TaxID=2802975 RepID=A0ABM8HPV2_9BACT|nr:helix-hairpin-helix domain-containing protein [Desulfuromonas versatilis]BCR04104.1 competence protein ComEA [Desulfuromonas versatilis]